MQHGARYGGLWIFALVFGWNEAATVVYLREVYLSLGNSVASYPFALVSLPSRLIVAEVVREGCTIVMLGSVGWLAGRRWADRIGAFLLLFGIWDLIYYAVLRLLVGWPASLMTWDVLFLIPLPWVGPVWAPATVAAVFIMAGSYLFWTPERPRDYGRRDIAMLLASALVIIGSFLARWRLALDPQLPREFPAWLFWIGAAVGTGWFVHVERRMKRPT
jgi:hypothetical protein